jgi:hypothetical protein
MWWCYAEYVLLCFGGAFNPFGVEEVYFFCCHRISCGDIDVEVLPAAGRTSSFTSECRDSCSIGKENQNPEGIKCE